MKKIVIATIALALTLTAFADEYTKRASATMREEFTMDRYFAATNKLYIEAEGFRADAVYKYEAAALAKQQRLLLKKQEELIAVQTELAKEQLKATKNANKVVSVYANLLESVPAIIATAETYEKFQKVEDKETKAFISIWKAASLLLKRPLTTNDLQSALEAVLKAEGRIK